MAKVAWRRKVNAALVLSRIDKSRTINPTGGASFSGFGSRECLPVLHSMLDFSAEARSLDTPNLVWRALAAVRGKLTPDSFLGELDARVQEKLSGKQGHFNVLTSISLPHGFGRQSYTINGVRIRLLAGDYPSRVGTSRRELLSLHRNLPISEDTKFTRVIASLKAADPNHAVEQALRAIDLIRAWWCFTTNYANEISGDSWRPINTVWLGSLHTCHFSNGKAAGTTVWFDPHRAGEPVRKPSAKVAKAVEARLKLVRISPFRKELEDAMVSYVRALDTGQQDSAFMSLWTAMEKLVSSGQGEQESLVRRCAFLFEDRAFHLEVLKHLRLYRNEYVHEGRTRQQAKAHCYELQGYFRELMDFYLSGRRYFSTLNEANAFLDLTPDKELLIRQREVLSRAIRFLR